MDGRTYLLMSASQSNIFELIFPEKISGLFAFVLTPFLRRKRSPPVVIGITLDGVGG